MLHQKVPKGKWEEERYMLVCGTEKKVKREWRGYAKRQATFRHTEESKEVEERQKGNIRWARNW